MFFAFCFLFSCRNKNINKTALLYKTYSTKVATKELYDNVYIMSNDSINNWVKKNLRSMHDKWQIDSLICFNNKVDKVIMSINSQSYYPNSTMDDLQFFYGVKIKDQWYFFTGATAYLPRKNYQKDITTPLSFEKLHEIAMKEVFGGYLIKDEKGNWMINDKFFERMENKNQTGSGYGSCLTCKTFEEYVMYLVNLNWQKK